jgi:hypothetical protein
VVRAPDPSDEVREVVRCIAAGLERESPVPLYETVIVYPQADPYAPTVRGSSAAINLRRSIARVPSSRIQPAQKQGCRKPPPPARRAR